MGRFADRQPGYIRFAKFAILGVDERPFRFGMGKQREKPMNPATQLLTADDLWRLPDDRNRHELVKGELRTMRLRALNPGLPPSNSLGCWTVMWKRTNWVSGSPLRLGS